MTETKYFGQTDMGMRIYSLYRKRYEDGIVYQEQWRPNTNSWELTTYLMRLLTGGDATISEITLEKARSSYPEAFSI
jgi:ribulose bisphosphate carboxylase small subunit